MADDIEGGTPIVGLEPACVSAFKDELPALFPADAAAKKLSDNAILLSDFLVRRGVHRQLSVRTDRALVQFHCHHHAVLKTDGEKEFLHAVLPNADVIGAGCCGMAGSFGFEAKKYGVSLQIAERMLAAIGKAPNDTLILANGFSCREQIEQLTGRRTRHLAECLSPQNPVASRM